MESAAVTNHPGQACSLHPQGCPTYETSYGRFLGTRGGASHRHGLGAERRVYCCRTCRLIYVDAMPIPARPSEIYGDADTYFENHDPESKVVGAQWLIAEIVRRSNCDLPRVLDLGSGRGEVLRGSRGGARCSRARALRVVHRRVPSSTPGFSPARSWSAFQRG